MRRFLESRWALWLGLAAAVLALAVAGCSGGQGQRGLSYCGAEAPT